MLNVYQVTIPLILFIQLRLLTLACREIYWMKLTMHLIPKKFPSSGLPLRLIVIIIIIIQQYSAIFPLLLYNFTGYLLQKIFYSE